MMIDAKLGKIFEAARKETPRVAPDGFEFLVMNAIRQEPAPRGATIFDQLNLLFPRLAVGAMAVIALCVAGDWLASGLQLSLTDGVAQLSQQWLLTGNGF
jgi:hypothetical protein